MLKTLFILSLCILCYSSDVCAGVVTPDDNKVVEVPFLLYEGCLVVQVKVKDKGPYNMVLATGSPTSKIIYAVADEVKLQAYFTYAKGDPSLQTYVSFLNVPDMRIGELQVPTLMMNLVDLDAYSQSLGVKIYGVLGYDFLKGRILQIDYPHKIARFLPKTKAKQDQKVNGTANQSASVSVQIEIIPEDPVPIIYEVMIDGKKFKALLDTHQGVALSLTPAAIKQFGLPPSAEKAAPRMGSVGSIQIGSLKQDSPNTAFFGKGNGLDHGLNKYGAIIGAGFMAAYTVTFDYVHKVITFE